ncbi:MAG: hypothetical protein QNJ97_13865 [Myxococcota bacterium]|nr:hypothetical protein [Myxococcota bacterium]
MKVLEIIQLRSAANAIEILSERIDASIQTAGETSMVLALYRRNELATDLAIHIHRSADQGSDGPSELGLRLASELKAYGLVDHTLWEELK